MMLNTAKTSPPVKGSRPKRQVKLRKLQKVQLVADMFDQVVIGIRSTQVSLNICYKYGISKSQADKYLAQAKDLIRTTSTVGNERALARGVEVRREISRRALSVGDLNAALAAERDLSKLLGHYPIVGSDGSGSSEGKLVIFIPDREKPRTIDAEVRDVTDPSSNQTGNVLPGRKLHKNLAGLIALGKEPIIDMEPTEPNPAAAENPPSKATNKRPTGDDPIVLFRSRG